MTAKNLFVRVLAAVLLTGGVYAAATLAADDTSKTPASGPSAAKAGHIVGIVTDKNEKTLVVKPDDPNGTMTFPRPENKAVAALWKTFFPDHVVDVNYDMVSGQPVMTGLKLVSPVSGSGKVTGILTEKNTSNKTYVEVKAANAPTARFVPMWDPSAKGYKKASVDAITAANVGDKVEVSWIADFERVHMTALQVVTKAAAAPAATTPAAATPAAASKPAWK